MSKLQIPPSVKLKMQQMIITVYRGENFAALDSVLFGAKKSSDPYIIFNFGSMVLKSSVQKSTLNPRSFV